MIGEILAPVSSFDMLHAAADGGADAVYVGLKEFNARRNAENFTLDELGLVTEYCRIRGILVYLAFNIVIKDSEFEHALSVLKEAAGRGIDAVILQDLGLASAVREAIPDLPIHASTQLSVHNAEGVEELEKLGFSRVCLAREMSFDEIRKTCEKSRMEIEVFVHGAHCMSVSGQCYFSAMLGGRSGNRGLCAQVCRLPFSNRASENALSLKDMSIVQNIPKLMAAGVCSFKIEGRMKRPEYVFAASAACKQSMQESADFDESYQRLKNVFSRSGFTDGYYKADRTADMFGIRTKQDIADESFLKTVKSRGEFKRVGLVAEFTAKRNEPARLILSDGINTAETVGMTPEIAVNKSLTSESAEINISKLGATPYFIKSLKYDIDDGIMLPASEINRLRRDCVDELSRMRSAVRGYGIREYDCSVQKLARKSCGSQEFFGVFNSIEQIPDNAKELDTIIFNSDENAEAISELMRKFSGFVSFGTALPRCEYGDMQGLYSKLTKLKQLGVRYALCNNLYAINIAEKCGFEIIAGSHMNITNSHRPAHDKDPEIEIASFELKASEINRLSLNGKKGVIAYGYLPLMLTRACPMSAVSCKKCGRRGVLTDRKGEKFRVLCRGQYQEVLNSRPLCLSDRLSDFDCDCYFFKFTIEDKNQCAEIINAYINQMPYDNNQSFTRGLYYRGVL